MESVMPQLVGRVQGARRATKFIASDEGERMAEAGEKVRRAGDQIGGLVTTFANHLGKMAEENYAILMDEMGLEADKIYFEEVTSHTGASAEGAVDRFQMRYGKLFTDYYQRVPWGLRERYKSDSFRYETGRISAARGYEFQETQRAAGTAYRQMTQRAVDRATTSLDPDARAAATAEAVEAFTENFRLSNGGYVYTPQSLAAFDADYNDGNSGITLPERIGSDGTRFPSRTYTIVEDDEYHGEEGYIPRSRIVAFRERMAQQAAAYQSGVTAIYDEIHSKTITLLLQNNRVGEAEEYLRATRREGGYPASEAVYSTLWGTVARHRQVLDDVAEVNDAVVTILNGETYYSEAMEARFDDLMVDVGERYADDPERRNRLSSELRTRWATVKAAMKSQLDRDVAISLGQIPQIGFPKWGEKVRAMEDSPLKARLMTILERREAAERSAAANTPEFHYQQQRALQMFKLAVSKKEPVTVNGVTYDLSKPDGVTAFMQAQGFVGDYARQAGQYAAMRPEARPDMARITAAAASALGLSVTMQDMKHNRVLIQGVVRHLEQRCLRELEPGKVDTQTLRVWAAQYLIENTTVVFGVPFFLNEGEGQ